jgi:DNA-binding transcriptional ArsR family regulator
MRVRVGMSGKLDGAVVSHVPRLGRRGGRAPAVERRHDAMPPDGLDYCSIVGELSYMTSVFRALADPTRRTVLQLLRQRPMTAGELAEHFDVTKSTMSAHFAVLTSADLIEAEKQGRTITYRLKMSVLEEALMEFTRAFGLQATPPTDTKAPARARAEER